MKLPRFTLTQNKVISVCGWSVVVVLQAIALRVPAPVARLPLAAQIPLVLLLLLSGIAVVGTALGIRTEKPDERAVYNQYRANSTLFTLIFFLFGIYLLFGDGRGWETLCFTRGQIIFLFGLLCLLQDGLFLLYERLGH